MESAETRVKIMPGPKPGTKMKPRRKNHSDPYLMGIDDWFDGLAKNENPCRTPESRELWEIGWMEAENE